MVVVFGASNVRIRDAKAKELLTKGLRQLAMDSAHSARSASILGVSPK